MLETFSQIIQIIYLLVILVILFYIFVLPMWEDCKKYVWSDSSEEEYEHQTQQYDEKDIIESQEISDLPNYRPYDHQFELASTQSSIEYHDENFGFSDLLKIYKKKEFLVQYQSSLDISFKEKLSIYLEKLQSVERDIQEAQAKQSGGMYARHDTTLIRLEAEKSEIDDVIRTIGRRKSNNTIERIQKNFRSMIYHKKFGFRSLIGREKVKDYLALKIYTFSQNPRVFFHTYQNLILTGHSGVGKTKVGETMGYIYSKSGILARDKFRVITAQDLVSKYVGDSGQVAREKLLSCLEGFLLIDEAYELGHNDLHNHHSESVTELVNSLSTYKGLLVVGAAGYKDEMEGFRNANKGIKRRFSDEIHLESYSSKQLTHMLIKFIKDVTPDIEFSNKDGRTVYTLIDYVYQKDPRIFEHQAGDMEKLSGHINRSIYGNNRVRWGNTRSNAYLIQSGFNHFLRQKGVILVFPSQIKEKSSLSNTSYSQSIS